MLTDEAIDIAARKFSENHSASNIAIAYYSFKKGVKWALKQVQSEQLQLKSKQL